MSSVIIKYEIGVTTRNAFLSLFHFYSTMASSDEEGEEFEFNDNPPPRRKSSNKAVKREEEDDFIDDDDVDDTAVKKKKKSKVKREDSDDDDDDFREEETPKPKKKIRIIIKKDSNDKKRKVSVESNTTKKKVKREDDVVKKKVKKEVGKVKKESSGGGGQRELKKLNRTERLQYAMQSFLWWDAKEPPEGCQWSTMEHAGVSFPDSYVPHRVKMKYDGKPIELTPLEEEAATFFAAMDPDGMHLGNKKTAPIFIKNFFDDFREVLGKKHIIKDYKKCDFEPIRKYLNEQKIIKKAMKDEEKKVSKEDRDTVLFKFGYSIVDGHIEKVGNYNMEPPGAFRGRGEHPKMGKLKQRVLPEQVSINVSECAPIPQCPLAGHAWSDVRHDPRGMWLATWKENINNQVRKKDVLHLFEFFCGVK